MPYRYLEVVAFYRFFGPGEVIERETLKGRLNGHKRNFGVAFVMFD